MLLNGYDTTVFVKSLLIFSISIIITIIIIIIS